MGTLSHSLFTHLIVPLIPPYEYTKAIFSTKRLRFKFFYLVFFG